MYINKESDLSLLKHFKKLIIPPLSPDHPGNACAIDRLNPTIKAPLTLDHIIIKRALKVFTIGEPDEPLAMF